MNTDYAVLRACREPTLVDALSWIAIWESDRAVRQALEQQRTGIGTATPGQAWDTCFKFCFKRVLEDWQSGAMSKHFPNCPQRSGARRQSVFLDTGGCTDCGAQIVSVGVGS